MVRPTVDRRSSCSNKADLTGSRRRRRDCRARTGGAADVQRRQAGIPTVAMAAAAGRVDGRPRRRAGGRAAHVGAHRPPNLASVDAFAAASPVGEPGRPRTRLLDRLDRFGIAHAVLALADGTDPSALPAHLRGREQRRRRCWQGSRPVAPPSATGDGAPRWPKCIRWQSNWMTGGAPAA